MEIYNYFKSFTVVMAEGLNANGKSWSYRPRWSKRPTKFSEQPKDENNGIFMN